MTLKQKITLMVAIPTVAFIALMVFSLTTKYDSYTKSDNLKFGVELLKKMSAVVHETQKESGQTAVFLSGNKSMASLQKQRQVNDSKIAELKNQQRAHEVHPDIQSKINLSLSQYQQLREQVTNRSIETKAALSGYTAIIKNLLSTIDDVKGLSNNVEVEEELANLYQFESAKENGGKFRANISSALGHQTPLTSQKRKMLMGLYAGLYGPLSSDTLHVKSNIRQTINEFLQSESWELSQSDFLSVLSDRYETEPEVFFTRITEALGLVSKMIHHEFEAVDEAVAHYKQATISSLFWSGLLSIGCILLSFFSIRYVNVTINILVRLSEDLEQKINPFTTAAKQLLDLSGQLSTTTQQQAAALQESVASLTQIEQMVGKNTESAEHVTTESSKSRQVASSGKNTVESMIEAIQDISTNNSTFSNEITKSNQELMEIVEIINQIGEKAEVINDIVFQTKLLSFNASVEAARAGEQGKGFAVVAEEVGNLANMSGTAASEISGMLEGGIVKVNDIVNSTKSKIEGLIEQGRGSVDQGTQRAQECQTSLDSILESVSAVAGMIEGVSSSSREQAEGVQQINDAMNEMNSVTQQNSGVATQVNDSAESLMQLAGELQVAVDGIQRLTEGKAQSHRQENHHWETTANSPHQEAPTKLPTSTRPTSEASHLKKVSGDSVGIGELPSENHPDFEDF
jgi:methyl-accepting chemotaxis protein